MSKSRGLPNQIPHPVRRCVSIWKVIHFPKHLWRSEYTHTKGCFNKKSYKVTYLHTQSLFFKKSKMRQPGERNKVISKVLAFSWQGLWVIACQLLVTAAKAQDCWAQIAGNGHLLFVNFCLSRDSAEKLLRSAGNWIWPVLPGVPTA